MRGMTETDLGDSVSGVLSRFGIDKDQARRTRRDLDARIGIQPPADEPAEVNEQYYVCFVNRFGMVDLSVEDVLMPTLKAAQQSVYRRLYRLSFLYGRNWCQVSNRRLQQACNMSSQAVRSALNVLIDGECIRIITPAFQRNPPVYRIYLPCEMSKFADIEAGVIFTKEKPAPGELRALDFRGLKNRGVKFRPLIIDSLKELRPQEARGQDQEIRGLKMVDLTGNGNDSNGLDSGKIDGKAPINSIIKEILINNSSLSDTVTGFYNSIGQAKISKGKREKGKKVIEELLEDGFSVEDIQFAVEWTPANAKEDLYDFSIIKHTIGQAMAVKAEVDKAAALRSANEEARQQEQADREAEEAERGKLEALKGSLSDEERSELRLQAENAIKASGEYKAAFITDALIEAKENEILRTK